MKLSKIEFCLFDASAALSAAHEHCGFRLTRLYIQFAIEQSEHTVVGMQLPHDHRTGLPASA